MLGLGKILPLLIIAGAAKEGVEKMQPLLDYSQSVAVQSEMNNLSRMILLDYTTDEYLPTEEEFPDWVRRSQQAKGNRDPANDSWGTPYRLETKEGGIVIIRSAGADKKYNTKDDLKSQVRLP